MQFTQKHTLSSLGHSKHEYTSQSAIESVFRLLAAHSEPAGRSALARSMDYISKVLFTLSSKKLVILCVRVYFYFRSRVL